jgi:predicted dehydrogenase
MQFVGETGTLFVTTPFTSHRYSWLFYWNGQKYRPIFIPGESLYKGEIEDLTDAILKGTPQEISLADSRNNTAVLLALYQSARSNCPVTL